MREQLFITSEMFHKIKCKFKLFKKSIAAAQSSKQVSVKLSCTILYN